MSAVELQCTYSRLCAYESVLKITSRNTCVYAPARQVVLQLKPECQSKDYEAKMCMHAHIHYMLDRKTK